MTQTQLIACYLRVDEFQSILIGSNTKPIVPPVTGKTNTETKILSTQIFVFSLQQHTMDKLVILFACEVFFLCYVGYV